MSTPRRKVVLTQLPIPPLGLAPVRGNVPLAGAYLKLHAEHLGLDSDYDVELLPSAAADTLGDRALATALAERDPWMVGFTCYLWNVERTLWVAAELKRRRPAVRVVLGGPEITPDNAWVLDSPDYDFAAIGEGEQTFARLLLGLLGGDDVPPLPGDGLYVPPPRAPSGRRYDPARRPTPRTPMPDLNRLGSPYLAGILDAADEGVMLLETVRGCVFKCKFCYYPKSYDRQYYLAEESVRACLRHAIERGADEVVLLDPTLNQRKDFADLLRLLAEGNPGHGRRRFRYFGELRAEGITAETARLLDEANFREVEVGLQSVEPEAMTRMERKNNLRAFERGVRAMLARDIRVKVDLIIGLPGDTPASVRRGLHYLRDNGLFSEVQVFNLSVLPGTAFRQEAAELGLEYQPRPPYHVLRTPTFDAEDLFGLVAEAQELFGVEFDAPPPPMLDAAALIPGPRFRHVDLDLDLDGADGADPERQAQAFTLWLRSVDFAARARREQASAAVRRVLRGNPFTTLQVVLEPLLAEALPGAGEVRRSLRPDFLGELAAACQEFPTYLDRYYLLHPGPARGSRRLVVLLPAALRDSLGPDWCDDVGELASIVWRGPGGPEEADMEPYEFAAPQAASEESKKARTD
jgi:radical SAM superfamily enzyme YgiQ (UPF0313 family)